MKQSQRICAKETEPFSHSSTAGELWAYIITIAPKTMAIMPPETRLTIPALKSAVVSEAAAALVLDAASELMAEAEREEVPVVEELDALVDEAVLEGEELVVLAVVVVIVEGDAVVELVEALEVVAEALLVDAAEVELALAVAPETLKRGR